MSFAREAILKAAAHIEQNPRLYNFFKHDIPQDGEQGCLLGWIGRFAGMQPELYALRSPYTLVNAANKIGFSDDAAFYQEMHNHGDAGHSIWDEKGWAYHASDAAKALRSLAETV